MNQTVPFSIVNESLLKFVCAFVEPITDRRTHSVRHLAETAEQHYTRTMLNTLTLVALSTIETDKHF